jgi:hypothetical protein
MNWFSNCYCVGTRGDGGQPHIVGVCPDECVTVRSVIYPAEQGVLCGTTLIVKLEELVEQGDCSNIDFSIYNTPTGVTATLIANNELVITNAGVDTVGYVEVLYKVNCTTDLRSAIGFVKFYVGPNDICV